jgi:hypothetical protein
MTVRVSSWGSGLFPTRAAKAFAALALLGGMAGCKPDLPSGLRLPPKPDLSGKWDYRALDMRVVGSTRGDRCTIDGLVITLGRWTATGAEGRTSGGRMTCSGELNRFSAPLPSYSLEQVGIVYHRVGFSFAGPDWRHEGQLSHDTVTAVVLGDTLRRQVFSDTMYGDFRLRSGTLTFTGKFHAVRRPGPAS